MQLKGHQIKEDDNFTYRVGIQSVSGDIIKDVKNHIGKANGFFKTPYCLVLK